MDTKHLFTENSKYTTLCKFNRVTKASTWLIIVYLLVIAIFMLYKFNIINGYELITIEFITLMTELLIIYSLWLVFMIVPILIIFISSNSRPNKPFVEVNLEKGEMTSFVNFDGKPMIFQLKTIKFFYKENSIVMKLPDNEISIEMERNESFKIVKNDDEIVSKYLRGKMNNKLGYFKVKTQYKITNLDKLLFDIYTINPEALIDFPDSILEYLDRMKANQK